MTLDRAILCIPSDDREVWITVGMALKSELGDAGRDLFDSWSQLSSKYKASTVATVWRSFKAGGGITIASLYKLARDHGYSDDPDKDWKPDPAVARRRVEALREEAAAVAGRQLSAAATATRMLSEAKTHWHPYLVGKGLAKERMLVWSGDVHFVGKFGPYTRRLENQLLIPVRDFESRRLTSCQLISDDGTKLFLPGGRMSSAGHVVGPLTGRAVLCEGVATGLSIWGSLQQLKRVDVRVVICMSASNLVTAAKLFRGWVVADNDPSGAGGRYARETGLPTWMPETAGMDANDYVMARTQRALTEQLAALLFG